MRETLARLGHPLVTVALFVVLSAAEALPSVRRVVRRLRRQARTFEYSFGGYVVAEKAARRDFRFRFRVRGGRGGSDANVADAASKEGNLRWTQKKVRKNKKINKLKKILKKTKKVYIFSVRINVCVFFCFFFLFLLSTCSVFCRLSSFNVPF